MLDKHKDNSGRFKKGHTFWLGKKHPHSQEWLDKMKEKMKEVWQRPEYKEKMMARKGGQFKSGKEHPNWKNGISKQKGYSSFQLRRRRYRKKKAGGSHTLYDWKTLKAQYNWTCPCCKKQEPKIELVEDHIIPISKGGSDNIENIQPLCRSCNAKKFTKIITY